MPTYPNATRIDHFTASLLNGGGRHTTTSITADPMAEVVAWFEEKLGPPPVRELDDNIVWQWRSPGRVVEEIRVRPFDPDSRPECQDLTPDEIETFRTTIIQEYHVLPKPKWWQFWKPRW